MPTRAPRHVRGDSTVMASTLKSARPTQRRLSTTPSSSSDVVTPVYPTKSELRQAYSDVSNDRIEALPRYESTIIERVPSKPSVDYEAVEVKRLESKSTLRKPDPRFSVVIRSLHYDTKHQSAKYQIRLRVVGKNGVLGEVATHSLRIEEMAHKWTLTRANLFNDWECLPILGDRLIVILQRCCEEVYESVAHSSLTLGVDVKNYTERTFWADLSSGGPEDDERPPAVPKHVAKLQLTVGLSSPTERRNFSNFRVPSTVELFGMFVGETLRDELPKGTKGPLLEVEICGGSSFAKSSFFRIWVRDGDGKNVTSAVRTKQYDQAKMRFGDKALFQLKPAKLKVDGHLMLEHNRSSNLGLTRKICAVRALEPHKDFRPGYETTLWPQFWHTDHGKTFNAVLCVKIRYID